MKKLLILGDLKKYTNVFGGMSLPYFETYVSSFVAVVSLLDFFSSFLANMLPRTLNAVQAKRDNKCFQKAKF